jgi:hypothetical protein
MLLLPLVVIVVVGMLGLMGILGFVFFALIGEAISMPFSFIKQVKKD